ncbi:ATP-grasp domain-containing protein [Yinghuangia seranimata]|uniref:ATP-grasp domain-containing protein n=1 Tax=Yinghuangia seranimata TaxID=408067 RepID=UPI00248D356C|nr:hypothetical protein [Yinghuangia seranimata]MDI2124642.1 hypothetical protein [Yinghuangia seranimata]
MKLCFLVEDKYRRDGMPLDLIGRLSAWGHEVDVVEPGRSLVPLDVLRRRGHDAWILKTVSEGPGLSLLDAAAACGITTINDARAVRSVRDKAVAAAVARRCALPVPETLYAAVADVVDVVDPDRYPIVVKPVAGHAGKSVHLVRTPDELAAARDALRGTGAVLVQSYVPNSGVDYKVYSLGGDIHATLRTSPLHPDRAVRPREVPVPDDMARTVAGIGEVFGLDLFGVDVVEGPDGWVVVDVNDFPSFRAVPDAVDRVARTILRLAARPVVPPQGRSWTAV